MPQYVNVPISTDPDALAQDAFDYLALKNPGWEPDDAQLDTWIISANARMAATLRDLASDVPIAIFRYFGKLVNVPPIDETFATGTVTINVANTLGHTVFAGTTFVINDSNGIPRYYETVADAIIPGGVATLANVGIVAVESGSLSSNVGAASAVMTPVDQIDWLTNAVMAGATGGGTDGEEDSVYIDRLVANLQMLSPAPVTAADFATFARNTPGVFRALALDGYDAVALTNGNARTVTVALMDASGNAVSAGIKTTVVNALLATREANFVTYAIDASYSTIDVQWDVNKYPNFDPTDVSNRINTALATFLSPTRWGNPQSGDVNLWFIQTLVKINDLIGVVYGVPGVKDVNTVTARISPAAFAATDITLTGPAPVTRAGTCSGTVH
jgi:hypothetical protein